MKKKKSDYKKLIDDFDQEISSVEEEIIHLDKNRKPWPMYDQWLGTPQDRLRNKIGILEFLKNYSFSWKDEHYYGG